MPWLTSIHSTINRGHWGASSYRGNCGGYLIKDLLAFYEPTHVLDPMTGSGTCQDLCKSLKVPCTSFDLRAGRCAGEAGSYADLEPYDFPPYWRMIRYGDDPRCFSRAPTLEEFMGRLGGILKCCQSGLAPGGKIAVLIGDYHDPGLGRQVPLSTLTTSLAIDRGLWPACTPIIRLQHGNASSRRSHSSAFIPGVHDTCLVFERA
ncbi:hypothetical protein [Engelhardtia mirabilis]|uniref:hypothetical protein n=1 Tax=Engelhardtia mirabilis TaxID=2528011 RepID=UPI00119CF21C